MVKPFLILLAVTFLSLEAIAAPLSTETTTERCMTPQIIETDQSAVKSTAFTNFNEMESQQRRLLNTFLEETGQRIGYVDWVKLHNDRASTFLSVTHALSLIHVTTSPTKKVSGLDMIVRLENIRGDRLIVEIDNTLIKDWIDNGGDYEIELPDGHSEVGQVHFADHSMKGGALHCGYDIQGYTNYRDVPHLHWNYNYTNHLADIHLDGIVAWYGGVIPNPNHLNYINSDVRYWFKKYLHKYGYPGFLVGHMVIGGEL